MTMLVTENCRENDINFSKEFPLLSKSFVETCKAHALYAEGKLRTDKLIREVQQFDTTYQFIDGPGYFSWAKIHKELLQKIKDATDFTQAEKEALIDGLDYNSGDLFRKTFPFSRIIWTYDKPPAEVVAFNNGEFDENRIRDTQARINTLMACWDTNNVPGLGRDNVMYTKAAPNPRLIKEKLGLNARAENAVRSFEMGIRRADLDYLMMWMPALQFWGTSWNGRDRIAKEVTKLYREVMVTRVNPIQLTDGSTVRAYTFYHSNRDKEGGITLVLN